MSNTYFNISDKLRLYEFDGLLDQYGDAAAAYSLRKLRSGYTGSAIRVRRSSDNTERDIRFWNNELDTVDLLDWVNEEYTFIQEPFDGEYTWSVALGSASVTSGVLDFPDTSNTVVFTPIGNTLRRQQVRVTFTILNYQSGTIRFENFNNGASGTIRNSNGTYTEVLTILESGNNNFGFVGDMQGQIDDFKIEQLTADGLAHTWYDQSANANHAVQGTATAQPKIVDAGAVVEDNGKPAIIYDDVDDFFPINSLFTNADGEHSVYSVINQNNLAGTILGIVSSGGYYFRYTSTTPSSLLWYLPNTTNAAMSLTGPTGQGLISLNIGGGTAYAYVNNTLNNSISSTGPLNNHPNGIGRYASANYFGGYMQEIVAYEVNTISSRNDINTNINTYYDIY